MRTAALVAVLLAGAPGVRADSDAALVARFAPAPRAAAAPFVRADFDGSGRTHFLAAAYAVSRGTLVRAIDTDGEPAVRGELRLAATGAVTVKAVDLDGDRKSEIVVADSAPGGLWRALEWSDGALRNIGPASGGPDRAVRAPLLVDLDNDGRIELLVTESVTVAAYALTGGVYARAHTFIDYSEIGGSPADFDEWIPEAPPGDYVLWLGLDGSTTAAVLFGSRTLLDFPVHDGFRVASSGPFHYETGQRLALRFKGAVKGFLALERR